MEHKQVLVTMMMAYIHTVNQAIIPHLAKSPVIQWIVRLEVSPSSEMMAHELFILAISDRDMDEEDHRTIPLPLASLGAAVSTSHFRIWSSPAQLTNLPFASRVG